MMFGANPGFWQVARREVQWLMRDRVALILIFGVPLFAFVVLTDVFSNPVIRGLGVAIVDADRSDSSRALIELSIAPAISRRPRVTSAPARRSPRSISRQTSSVI